jgi:hypothetical protein
MKQEDKDLLLQDLCGRIPYGVKMNHIADDEHSPSTLLGIDRDYVSLQSIGGYSYVPVEHYRPYLFPMSSITEEQKKFFKDRPIFLDSENELVVKEDFFGNSQFTMLDDWMEVILWLVKNHFDYRNLIPKGLAIDCTGLNIY